MTDGILKLIMKHPFAFLFTSLLLMAVFPLAIFILQFKSMIALGLSAIIFFGIAMGCFPMCLWWLVTYIIYKDSFYEKLKDNKIEYNYEVISFPFVITVGSSTSILFCIIAFVCCYLSNSSFKVFLFICLLIPFIRLLIYLFFERKIFKTQEFQEFIDDLKF